MRINLLIGMGLFAALVMTLFWAQIAAILVAVGYVLVGIVAVAAVGIGFFGSWLLAENMLMRRAHRIEAEKQAHVLTFTDGAGNGWVRDTDKKATWRNLTGTPALYVNGTQHTPADWELEIYKMKLAAQAQTRTAAAQVIPGTAQLLPEPAPLDLLAAMDTVQRGLIVGASGSGKTTLLQWLVNRRRQTSKVVVFDPHGWPDKWPGCYVIGAGRNYAEIGRALAGLMGIINVMAKLATA